MDHFLEHSRLLDEIRSVFSGVGLHCEKFDYPNETEMPALVFNMPEDSKNRERLATLVFVPIEETDELKHSRLLQVVTEMPFKSSKKTLTETLKCLALINNFFLAGNLNFNGDTFFFRFSYFLPKDYDLKNISVFETIIFNLAFLDPYVEALEKVVDGLLTAEEALDYLNNLPQ